ncbi:MAG TPA: hypothetical protein VGL55_07520 [Steroidobacteraceae bacterium]
MSVAKPSLFEAILARLSLGAIPVDGTHWFDPKKPAEESSQGRCEGPNASWSPETLRISAPR